MTAPVVVGLGSLVWSVSAPLLLVASLLVLLVAITCQRAWRRLAVASLTRRLGVVALNILALCAMLALLMPPSVRQAATAEVTLLTAGSDGADLRGRLFVVDDDPVPEGKVVERLSTTGQLLLREPDLKTLMVSGHGLSRQAWRGIPDNVTVDWSPPEQPILGPVDVRWPTVIPEGEALVVSGELRLAAGHHRAEVRLLDPAGQMVFSRTAAHNEAFSVTATPKATGAMIYRLQIVLGDEILADEPVAVYVREGKPLQLLVLQSAPSFETRQLVDWLTDRGSRAIIHTRISEDRDLVQGINLPEAAATDISAGLLAATDIAVLDGRRWVALSPGERARFYDAVASGLGLLLLADEALATWLEVPAQALQLGLQLVPYQRDELEIPQWQGTTPATPIPVAPWRIVTNTARQLAHGTSGDVLEVVRMLGQGRIGVSLLRERHRWLTQGDRSSFSRYWSQRLRQLARVNDQPRWLPPDTDKRLRPGLQARVCARTGSRFHFVRGTALASDITGDNLHAHVLHALVAPTSEAPLRCGIVWPRSEGWHTLRLLDTDSEAVVDEMMVYVAGANDWLADRAFQRQGATRNRVLGSRADRDNRQTLRPISPWWFWAVLVPALAGLWFERRFSPLP